MLLWIQSLFGAMRRHPSWHFTAAAFTGAVLGATCFAWTQHVSWFIGWYWAIVTVTTVGYGDVVPHTTLGRVIAMGTMLTVIPLLAAAFADWAAALTTLHFRRWIGMHVSHAREHWVILGFAAFIPHLLPDLLARYPSVILVANQVDRGHLPDHPGMDLIAGDPSNPHVLAKAQLAEARYVLVVGAVDGEVLMTAIEAHRLAPETPMLAITERRNAVQALRELGIPAMDTQSWLSQALLQHLGAEPPTVPR